MAQEGWICPRCGKVNAPWVMQCSCNRNTQILPKVGAPYYEGDQATCKQRMIMSKDKAIVHINNVSKMIGSKRIKLSEGMAIHIQNELVLALKELED